MRLRGESPLDWLVEWWHMQLLTNFPTSTWIFMGSRPVLQHGMNKIMKHGSRSWVNLKCWYNTFWASQHPTYFIISSVIHASTISSFLTKYLLTSETMAGRQWQKHVDLWALLKYQLWVHFTLKEDWLRAWLLKVWEIMRFAEYCAGKCGFTW